VRVDGIRIPGFLAAREILPDAVQHCAVASGVGLCRA
jgi:hypothetical protein